MATMEALGLLPIFTLINKEFDMKTKIKLWTIGVIGVVILLTAGCQCEYDKNPILSQAVVFDHALVGEDNLVYLPVSKNGTNYCYQKTVTDEWLSVEASVCEAQSPKEIISYQENTVTVTNKETGDILFTDTLPTVAQVAEETNTSYDGREAYTYTYLKMDDYNATWDRKTHFMAVGYLYEYFYENYYLLTKESNSTWNIQDTLSMRQSKNKSTINTIRSGGSLNEFPRYINLFNCDSMNTIMAVIKHSYLGKALNCPRVMDENYTCYTFDTNGSIISTELFGEVYAVNYRTILTQKFKINKTYKRGKDNYITTYTYFFDKQNRLNILYVDANANGNYMIYEMYENGNQTTPTLTQKVYL